MSVYSSLPERLLITLDNENDPWIQSSYCAGFELQKWRCSALASHIIEWMPDYALHEDELHVNHGNMYVRLQEAAVRVYATDKYSKRGEFGEITLHAICRDFFGTIPLAPRVFYKTSSNDVVKSFDMAHVRALGNDDFEIWLGESKLYQSGSDAIASAIKSIKDHISAGFLNREKLLIGPQISKSLPQYADIRKIFAKQTSLDALFEKAVFPICIACDSIAVNNSTSHTPGYRENVSKELAALQHQLNKSGLHQQVKLNLIYIPLASKDNLAKAFDKRLKGLLPEEDL